MDIGKSQNKAFCILALGRYLGSLWLLFFFFFFFSFQTNPTNQPWLGLRSTSFLSVFFSSPYSSHFTLFFTSSLQSSILSFSCACVFKLSTFFIHGVGGTWKHFFLINYVCKRRAFFLKKKIVLFYGL